MRRDQAGTRKQRRTRPAAAAKHRDAPEPGRAAGALDERQLAQATGGVLSPQVGRVAAPTLPASSLVSAAVAGLPQLGDSQSGIGSAAGA